MIDLNAPLKNVRGLGSAKSGTQHWIWQRLTAISLVPLGLWFVYSLVCVFTEGTHEAVITFFASSLNTTAMVVLLAALFYHSKLGLQVIIEDYIHTKFALFSLLLLNIVFNFAFALVGIVAVLKMHLGG